ncbi:hypothetical protein J1G44_06205 [Cellulomonas sp. zg-ZUI199]|uniref:T3SS peptide-binding chaperone domain-containing protein n=1 Tax=Cellulomonas wangleii TaxID=2816956 RepID=A0ABX8D6L1_9CELL|nr:MULTISPECIES: hypothetical protein [Cellulomonas]MBO0898924.1 hypothetical protein [Cellulomonas sp. zg-ZUI22]MBO0923789.1 hypothetical protein [Cellulomonas wangleii]MBO0924071.1 hypothetical protein [Cellulomonas wangleii]QVI62096.1 hypothetical protein KG103_17050 [Cellulomonas wangleii]
MSVDLEVDEEEYRFADRYVAARAWALMAALVERLPGMRVSQVVDETGTPLLIVHDGTEQERIQLDMVAWVLFGAPSREIQHLYWDEVFATRLDDVVGRIVAATGPVVDDGATGRLPVYRLIARALAVGLADDAGWWVQQVRIAGEWSAETLEVLRGFAGGESVAEAALDAALAGAAHDEPVVFHEPLWVLRRGLDVVALLDASTGQAHVPGGLAHPADKLVREVEVEPHTIGFFFRQVCAGQWGCLDPEPVVDPAVDLLPLHYGHVRAEAWRLVAALVARTDLQVVGPAARGEICRMTDLDGSVRLRMTTEGVHVGGSPVVRDWWDVFAAPLASSVPDALVDELPRRGSPSRDASGAERVHRFIARLLAAAVDDDGEWRVISHGEGGWAVLRGDDAVALLGEDGNDRHVDDGWTARMGAAVVLGDQ